MGLDHEVELLVIGRARAAAAAITLGVGLGLEGWGEELAEVALRLAW